MFFVTLECNDPIFYGEDPKSMHDRTIAQKSSVLIKAAKYLYQDGTELPSGLLCPLLHSEGVSDCLYVLGTKELFLYIVNPYNFLSVKNSCL